MKRNHTGRVASDRAVTITCEAILERKLSAERNLKGASTPVIVLDTAARILPKSSNEQASINKQVSITWPIISVSLSRYAKVRMSNDYRHVQTTCLQLARLKHCKMHLYAMYSVCLYMLVCMPQCTMYAFWSRGVWTLSFWLFPINYFTCPTSHHQHIA